MKKNVRFVGLNMTVARAVAVAALLAVPAMGVIAAPEKRPTSEKAAPEKPAPEKAAATPAKPGKGTGVGDFGNSKEPIKIDADRLDVYDKEGRAVFTGNVIAIQGDTTMHCTVMDVFYEQNKGQDGEKKAPSPGGMASDSSVKKIFCKGPVTITTKTQTATGDRAEFDRTINKVFLIGNAALTDGPNVTRGERVAYDLDTGVANVEGGRVRALIVPGSDKDKDAKDKPKDKDKTTASTKKEAAPKTTTR